MSKLQMMFAGGDRSVISTRGRRKVIVTMIFGFIMLTFFQVRDNIETRKEEVRFLHDIRNKICETGSQQLHFMDHDVPLLKSIG